MPAPLQGLRGVFLPVVDNICTKETVAFARVDAGDAEAAARHLWIWQGEGSYPARPDGAKLPHCVLGVSPSTPVEPRNRNFLDCRRFNLRTKPARNKVADRIRSRFRGVLRDPHPPDSLRPWLAYGRTPEGGLARLGYFRREEEAATRAREWERAYQSIHLEDDWQGGGFGRHLGSPKSSSRHVNAGPGKFIDREGPELEAWDWF